MLESLFNKVAGLNDCNFITQRLQHCCFPVKFAKFLRIPFLQNTSWKCIHKEKQKQPPEVFCKKRCLTPETLLIKRHWHRWLPVNFAKFLRTPFLTEHLRWLLLVRDTSYNKFLQNFHFHMLTSLCFTRFQ